MSVPSYVKGQYFDVAVDPDKDGSFLAICGLNSKNLAQAAQTSDEYIRDCDDPSQTPWRVINITGQSMTISGTGIYNRAQADLIRNLFGKVLPYRYIAGEDADDTVDSGHYAGNFALTNFQVGAADGANVTAQFTWESDGEVIFVPGDTMILLDILDLTPKTATHAVAWTGTVSGTTTGSTLTATSSDGTTITVTGTGTTRSLSATFAAAGNKTITLTETLTAARNSPKVTKIIVAAA